MKRVLVLTGGGDCPGLNAVIRAIVKRAAQEPTQITVLDEERVKGIHYQGGTIIETTNKGGPFSWPVKNTDGTWTTVDRSDELIRKLQLLGIEAVINIGGDGSQKISQKLYEKGLNIIGVPKTIDNDLSATDSTFGFQTAVQIATEALDKLVTTAASHNRVFGMEVMGRYAGWIALNAAIAGGADVCLIPEIPYDINVVKEKLESRFHKDRGFGIMVVAEGARPIGGDVHRNENTEVGYQNLRLGGVVHQVMHDLREAGFERDMRDVLLGHVQRGGVPIAYDRILASQFGVKAFEMVLEKEFGRMVSYQHPEIVSVPFEAAVGKTNLITPDHDMIETAKGLGISLGDK